MAGVAPAEDYEVWSENWAVFECFTLCQWQWVGGMGVMRAGLDQAAAWALIERHPDMPDDRRARWAAFEALQLMAAEALAVWAGSGGQPADRVH